MIGVILATDHPLRTISGVSSPRLVGRTIQGHSRQILAGAHGQVVSPPTAGRPCDPRRVREQESGRKAGKQTPGCSHKCLDFGRTLIRSDNKYATKLGVEYCARGVGGEYGARSGVKNHVELEAPARPGRPGSAPPPSRRH
ncbi:hypothetical protein EVAR_75162_1 [Eumeta japonica]|uniref:Uncharacterized protein n=1 Tax=Eumeta variegata TaxID=151549 RepID=A0A4C1U0R0_EUMVA|nr:hypothetical protein EVAR_75162_1 [Eumeta japonica]